MPDPIYIRKADPNESRILSELAYRSKSYWGYPVEFMEACRTELSVSESDTSNPERYYAIAEREQMILGYYALERISMDEYELEALFVEPAFIGQGIGRFLIEHAKDRAKANGATVVRIQGDPHAAEFYQTAGGIRVGERESGSIPGRYLPEYKIVLTENTASRSVSTT